MATQAVGEYIFPPLAGIVGQYAQPRYYLVYFDPEDIAEGIGIEAVINADSELDAVNKILQDKSLFVKLLPTIGGRTIDKSGDSFSVFTEHLPTYLAGDVENWYDWSDDQILNWLINYYQYNPELLLEDMNDTWNSESPDSTGYALIPDTDLMLQIMRRRGLIVGRVNG